MTQLYLSCYSLCLHELWLENKYIIQKDTVVAVVCSKMISFSASDQSQHSHEVDNLEIRWHELDPVVTKFVIVESNATFSGIPKLLYFSLNQPGLCLLRRLSMMYIRVELHLVGHMKIHLFLKQSSVGLWMVAFLAGISNDDLLIMSDGDEIPSRHTKRLLQCCDGVPTDLTFSAAGWHCSFRFRELQEYVFKMTAYSHANRVKAEGVFRSFPNTQNHL